ncbi:MAG: ABC transporter permease subunit [Armatimonadetes bacterium]|nr:ABC transporter permease subunit [Armatimonadota bacterium]
MSSPILDLSYRHYDGPLLNNVARWWSIAKMTMRLGVKKKFFWTLAALSGYWYLLLIVIFYFTDLLDPRFTERVLSVIQWKDQFVNAFSIGQLIYFILALMIGIGSIANDNRANALLVYLGKPCTKSDYLIGKWLGIAIPLFLVAWVPALVFFVYGALSFRSSGFLTQDPWLFFKIPLMCLAPAAIHASLAVGISSRSNQGRNAGAAYAAIYFAGLFFTKLMQILWLIGSRQDKGTDLVRRFYYCSVDGIQIAWSKFVMGTNGSMLFPAQANQRDFTVPAMESGLVLFGFLFVCVVGVLLAVRRIKAVEVVR